MGVQQTNRVGKRTCAYGSKFDGYD